MSDALTVGLSNQSAAEAGGGLQTILEQLIQQGVRIRLCSTCALTGGVAELPPIYGIGIGLPELLNGPWLSIWSLASDFWSVSLKQVGW